MKSDGREDENETRVRRVSDEAEESCLVDGLGGMDGNVGAEGTAQGEDSRPTDREANNKDCESGGSGPGYSGVNVVGVGFAVVAAECNGKDDDEPEDSKRASVLYVCVRVAAACAGDEQDGDFREDPCEVEDAEESRYVHA